MRVAYAVWNGRIAPVLDVARQVHIVGAESPSGVYENIPNENPMQLALRLTALGVGTLVCGAISRQFRATIAAYGIRVIPFVAGELSEVVRAHREGRLEGGAFAMPGCGRRQREGHRTHGSGARRGGRRA